MKQRGHTHNFVMTNGQMRENLVINFYLSKKFRQLALNVKLVTDLEIILFDAIPRLPNVISKPILFTGQRLKP